MTWEATGTPHSTATSSSAATIPMRLNSPANSRQKFPASGRSTAANSRTPVSSSRSPPCSSASTSATKGTPESASPACRRKRIGRGSRSMSVSAILRQLRKRFKTSTDSGAFIHQNAATRRWFPSAIGRSPFLGAGRIRVVAALPRCPADQKKQPCQRQATGYGNNSGGHRMPLQQAEHEIDYGTD